MDSELTTTPSAIDAKLERLAALKVEIAKTAPLKAEFDELRYQVQVEMEAMGSERTKAVAGVMAVISEKKTLEIQDEEAIKTWLDENVMDPEAYYIKKIDPTLIRSLQEERMRDYGEFLPGIAEVVLRTVSIRAAKK